jgi:hypothetical protein
VAALIVLVMGLTSELMISTVRSAYATSPTWRVVSNPGDDVLRDISCSTSSACVAVGGTDQTFAESWNGSAWAVEPTQNPGLSRNLLYRVSCVPSFPCYAVGDAQFSSFTHTLIEVWNGTSWQLSPSPNTADLTNVLYGVSCISATSCTAVGSHVASNAGSVEQTLVENWNGTAWQIVPSPSVASSSNYLSGVSCTTATFCVAAGYVATAGGYETLVETWNGTTWFIESSPNPGNTDQLNGVTCLSAVMCTAVGYSGSSTLIEVWNGTNWSVVSSPSSGAGPNVLSGVSCLSGRSCKAVGSFYNGSSYNTLVEDWNGTAWQILASSNDGTEGSQLFGLQCLSSGRCTAVGDYVNGASYLSLIESNQRPYARVAPSSGPPGIVVSLTAGGFGPDESVTFSYETGLTSPTSVVLCAAQAGPYGVAKCSGSIPTGATAGASGLHQVMAQGLATGANGVAQFTLT